MKSTNADFDQVEASAARSSLWERILNAEELCDCNNLEKLLAGCEIIAALDGRIFSQPNEQLQFRSPISKRAPGKRYLARL